MPELSQPPLGRKPNIPPVVPLSQAPPHKQEEYKDLLDIQETGEPVVFDSEPRPNSTMHSFPEDTQLHISDEDKLAFVESVLGAKPYAKDYQLFGGKVHARFQDRSVADSESIYEQLDADYASGAIKSDEQWQVALERYQMACGLSSFTMERAKGPLDMGGTFQECLTRLMRLPQPVYRALMEASRKFEDEVNFMVEKAGDPDFWEAGG
jgi:hypothetical protein